MRGLKSVFCCYYSHFFHVASLADAWIKIEQVKTVQNAGKVASLADAWIKIPILAAVIVVILVASLADAWIKIFYTAVLQHNGLSSHPSRMRGLKSDWAHSK